MASKKNKAKKNIFIDNNSYFYKFMVIALLVIIVLLSIRGCSSFAFTNQGIVTGDFDIYEITLKGTCECPTCEKCEECESASTQTKPVIKDIDDVENEGSSEEEAEKEYEPNLDEEKVVVYDKKNEWNANNYVPNIFKHASTEIVSGKIAPGSTNIYKFIVRNLNDFDVKYEIKFSEVNAHNINMKYRLKMGNNYIVGDDNHWVDESSLNQSFKNLGSKKMDTYFLEWKWFHNDKYDTPIGIDETSVYSLSIKIDAEEI